MKKLFAVVILALFACGAMALPSFLFMKRKRRTVGMSAFMEMPTTFPLLRHLMDGIKQEATTDRSTQPTPDFDAGTRVQNENFLGMLRRYLLKMMGL